MNKLAAVLAVLLLVTGCEWLDELLFPEDENILTEEELASGMCEITGWPDNPPEPVSIGLDWCPINVEFQVRSQAIYVAATWCAIAHSTTTPTPSQLAERRRVINQACDTLVLWDNNRPPGHTLPTCLCPPDRRHP